MVIHENLVTLLQDYTEKYLDRILKLSNEDFTDFVENYVANNSIKE